MADSDRQVCKFWAFYKHAEHGFWTAESLDLQEAIDDTMPAQLSKMISFLLFPFDSPVIRNLGSRISKGIQIQEAQCYYAFQNMRASIHLETYCDILKSQDITPELNFPSKTDWIEAQIADPDCEFCKLVVVDAIVKGLFGSSTLAALGWMMKDNRSSKISSAIRRIAQDQHEDIQFSYLVFKSLRKHICPLSLTELIKEAVGIEQEFVKSNF